MSTKVGIYLDMDPSIGGQFQYALSLLDALALNPDEFEVTAYCSRSVWIDRCSELNIPWKRITPLGINSKVLARLVRDRASDMIAPKWYQRMFTRQVLRDNIEVCIFPMPSTLATLASSTSVKTICAIHDLMFAYEQRFRSIDGFREDAYYYDLFGSIVREATVILVDADLGAQHIHETLGTVRAEIKKLPFTAPSYVADYLARIDDPAFAPARETIVRLSDEPYIFYPALVRPDKNHKNLIKALGILNERGVWVRALFTGSPDGLEDYLGAVIRESGVKDQIEFTSYVSNTELCYLYSNARALVMPTYAGPTNIPPLEAFALGCPVLISGIYAMPEQVGDAGILFDPDSPEEIADAIERVWLSDEVRRALTQKGHDRNRELGFPHFAETLKAIINEVAHV